MFAGSEAGIDVTALDREIKGQRVGTGKVRFVLRGGETESQERRAPTKAEPGHVMTPTTGIISLSPPPIADDKTGLTLTYSFDLTIAYDQMGRLTDVPVTEPGLDIL
jgi:hypothetical protein